MQTFLKYSFLHFYKTKFPEKNNILKRWGILLKNVWTYHLFVSSTNTTFRKAVVKGETHKTKLAEYIWTANDDHITLWIDKNY